MTAFVEKIESETIPAITRPYLLGRSLEQLLADADRAGFKGFRARQLFGWLYRNKIRALDETGNLPTDYRAWAAGFYQWGGLEITRVCHSADGSRKFAFRLDDGKLIEGILMPDSGRLTLCVSSQVGCAVDCKFCMTAKMGLQRQLRADEIVDQVRVVQHLIRDEPQPLTNLVFMGMGEPLQNLKNLIPALRLLISPQAFALSARKITVSTAGHVPGIEQLGAADLNVSLAVSLNATDDATRSALMPINRKWPLRELLAACKRFPLRNRRRVTFEYVLLEGVNDAERNALELMRLLAEIPHKINLIPFNPAPGLPFRRPAPERVLAFQKILLEHHESAFVRYSKGLDVSGACGQLVTELTA